MEKGKWFRNKWKNLKRFSIVALIGFVLSIIGAFWDKQYIMISLILIAPLIFMLVAIPILHWKDRYIGEKSNLWGILLVIETSAGSRLFIGFDISSRIGMIRVGIKDLLMMR